MKRRKSNRQHSSSQYGHHFSSPTIIIIFFILLSFISPKVVLAEILHPKNDILNLNRFPFRRRSHHASSTIQTTSSSSSYRGSYEVNPFSIFPTTPYDPKLKPWRMTNVRSSSQPQSRYSKRSTNPFQSLFADITSQLLTSNVVVFAFQVFYPSITQMGAKASDLILQGRELYRLFTPMFLHGGIGHLAVNSYSLYNLGPQVESAFGKTRFLATYLASGIAGNVLSAYMCPSPSVGASGAIFGLIGAYYVFLRQNQVFFGRSGERGLSSVRSVLFMNMVLGLSNPVIDNWGHFGGALGGAFMAYAFGPKLYLMGTPSGRRVIVEKANVRMPGW